MNAIMRAVKATYNFFAGDAIILSAVVVAFILGAVLARAAHAPNALVAVLFVAIIAGGLIATLSRELAANRKST
jgi:hypothetical protein